MTRTRIGVAILGCVVALILGATGTLDVVHCAILAAIWAALTAVWLRPLPDIPRLPPLPQHTHGGARRDVSALSWMVFDRDARLTQGARGRIRRLVEDSDPSGQIGQDMATHSNPSPARIRRWLESLKDEDDHG